MKTIVLSFLFTRPYCDRRQDSPDFRQIESGSEFPELELCRGGPVHALTEPEVVLVTAERCNS